MGRHKEAYPKGNLYLRNNQKANDNGEYPIYVQYIYNRQIAKASTGVFVAEKYWHIKNQRVRTTHPQAGRLNALLEKKKSKIDAKIIEYISDEPLTIKVLKDIVQDTFSGRIKAADQDFIQYTIKNIETRYTLEKIGYSVYYNSLKYMDTFKKFVKKETDSDILPMKNLTGELIVSYIDYRKTERNNSSQSINKTLTPLIQAAKKAASDELIKPAIATTIEGMYLDTKSKSVDDEEKSEDEKVRYLTEDQIKSFLELYPIVKYDRTREYMDMFLFAFHACGLRVSDIITLTWKNINFEERILKKTLVKGRVSHSFLLTDAALKILEEWKKKSYSERFVFGLLPDDFELSNEAELKRLTTNKNTAIKTSLKEIGKKMNLKFSLTMHTARHTFAVMALNQRKVSVHIISKLLAHANTSVTETVYAKFLPSTIDEEIKSKLVFDFLPSSMKDN